MTYRIALHVDVHVHIHIHVHVKREHQRTWGHTIQIGLARTAGSKHQARRKTQMIRNRNKDVPLAARLVATAYRLVPMSALLDDPRNPHLRPREGGRAV
jgi:hypothetical protein